MPGRNLNGFFTPLEPLPAAFLAFFDPDFLPLDTMAERGTLPADLRELFFVRAMLIWKSRWKLAFQLFSKQNTDSHVEKTQTH